MSRKSYHQHLAEKAAAREIMNRRRGSLVESETDAESLFSSTTYQSQYSSSSSPYLDQRSFLSPNPNNPYSRLHPSTTRTVSSTSYGSSSYSSPSVYRRESSSSPSRQPGEIPTFSAFPPDTTQSERDGIQQEQKEDLLSPQPNYLSVPKSTDNPRDIARRERRERRKKEKEQLKVIEKESRSTLLSTKFDSPIRQFVRYLTKVGLHDYTLLINLSIIIVIRSLIMVILREGGGGTYFDLRVMVDKRRIVEEVMWIIVVYDWVKRECEKGGRSMRSQVIGITTITLSPLSFLSGDHILPFSMTLRPLTLLSTINDSTSTFYLGLSLTVNQYHWIWAIVIGLYVLSRSLWIGAKDGAHYLEFCIFTGVSALYSRTLVCDSNLLQSLAQNLRWITFAKTVIPPSLQQYIRSHITWAENQVNEYCKATVPLPTFTALRGKASQHKIPMILTILSMVPPISILLYSSISLRPGTPQRPSPTLSFLPLIMFLISIPIFLFSEDKYDVLLPLMPITLLMALRGSAAKGSEITAGGGGGAEDEYWRVGVGLNVISMFSLISCQTGYKEIAVMTTMTVSWITLIGASPLCSLIVIVRQLCIVSLPSSILLRYIEPLEQLVIKGIFAIGWFWGMKKLIENAWAMGGLSGNGHNHKRKMDGMKKEKST